METIRQSPHAFVVGISMRGYYFFLYLLCGISERVFVKGVEHGREVTLASVRE